MSVVLLLLTLALPISTATAAHGPGLASSTDLEPCSGQDKPGASERCCFVCPPNLLALAERDGAPRPLVSATSLPAPELAHGTEPEPLRRPPRHRG
ncbi:MAG: hypothetical protein AB7S59_09185 [Parvibaculaceae bacterium]